MHFVWKREKENRKYDTVREAWCRFIYNTWIYIYTHIYFFLLLQASWQRAEKLPLSEGREKNFFSLVSLIALVWLQRRYENEFPLKDHLQAKLAGLARPKVSQSVKADRFLLDECYLAGKESTTNTTTNRT